MTNTTLLLKQLKNHDLDQRLAAIYGKEDAILSYQRQRYCDAITNYMALYGEDEVEIYSAPGRSEICGNHTDHQNGMVLAASINLDIIAVVGIGNTDFVDFASEGYAPIHFGIKNLDISEDEKGTTTALLKGVIKGMQDKGYKTGSFKAYLTSDVLSGSGLSSSAALEAIVGTILSGLYNGMKVSPVDIAIIGQYAENVYFGKPCGLMDQIACSVGDFVQIDFKNPGQPVVNKINFDIETAGYQLCIVDTKGSHANLTDDYAAIPFEMKQVASFFEKEYLSEIGLSEFLSRLPELYGKVGDRAVLRAFHFLTENERVVKAASALEDNRFHDFLMIIKESGDSSYKYLQNVYSIQYEQQQPIPVILALSENFLQTNGVCRIHGGGFAGTIQAFVKTICVAGYKEFIENILGKDSCHVLKIRKQGGIKVC